MAKLKVFKTPIGFHDAYVAAPSRKAALDLWGASTDLFSAGIAEQVTGNDKATKAALATPGAVVRVGRTRGKEEALPRTAPRKAGRGRNKARPQLSRAGVEKAEAAISALAAKQAAERAELAKEEAMLARRRRALEARHRKTMESAESKRDAAKESHREAMAEWDG